MAGYGNADDGTQAQLNHVEDSLALHAIASAQHNATGLCLECGGEIPTARLRAVPNANHCIECQRELDKDKSTARFVVKNHYQP